MGTRRCAWRRNRYASGPSVPVLSIEVPNLPVDVSSWGRSACYPRRTFYPMSDGPSMRGHRITMPYFRTCSARRPHSQAPFCHCAPRTVTKRAEGTFGSLRYLFGGDHPSQTARHAVSPRGLGPRRAEGGISTSAPRGLAAAPQSLPPMLHTARPGPAQSCSKGARGLSRYTIRAGRNLPDKEFRYLRTVIVTAAVYRGFGSALRLAADAPP